MPRTREDRPATRRDLIGRRITDVSFEDMQDSEGQTFRAIYSITLDTGRKIHFTPVETEEIPEVHAYTHTKP